jgi:hypothetical protein
MNDIVDDAFSSLPPPAPRTDDAAAARHIWLRARLAEALDRKDRRSVRLRLTGAMLTIGALDAAAASLVYAAGAPFAAVLAAATAAHALASVTFLLRP